MMRKIITIIALFVTLFISIRALAATSTLTFTAKCNGSGIADDGTEWTINSNGPESSFSNEKGVQFGTKSTGGEVSYLTLITSDISGTITQVKVDACGNTSYDTNVQVNVGGTAFIWTDDNSKTWEQVSLLSIPQDITFTGSASGEIRVYITQARAKSPIYCKSIEVTYVADVVVHDGETETVSVPMSVENLTIEEGGEVVLSDKKLTVNGDFVIKTSMGSGKSGQLIGATDANFEVKGDSYIDITLGDNGNPAKWHAFTVPFAVDASNGIYALDGTRLTNETHYAIMDYHGDIRANGQYGWRKFTGTMTPGTFYLMTVDGARTTYRMKATGDLLAAASKDFHFYTGTGTTSDQGWNGVGNPMLQYVKVAYSVQVLDPINYVYVTKPANSCNFVVGAPFFYQASADGSMEMMAADAAENYAPQRAHTAEPKQATIAFGNGDYTDYLYLSASEDASDSYEIGRDLAKLTISSQPAVVQIVSHAYGTSLCMVNAPISNNHATYAVSLYAPSAGIYSIAAEDVSGADVYLTREGVVLQDITNQSAQLVLAKGENDQYGLILSAPTPSITTDMEVGDTEKTAQKIIINNQMFILRAETLYDSTGKRVRQ